MNTLVMKQFWFHSFAKSRLGRRDFTLDDTVETCVEAMEQGALAVDAENADGDHLWCVFLMSTNLWTRICALRPPLRLLWKEGSMLEEATVLSIEYFWRDLDVVQAFYAYDHPKWQWISAETHRRRSWMQGLCRAWLVVCVSL